MSTEFGPQGEVRSNQEPDLIILNDWRKSVRSDSGACVEVALAMEVQPDQAEIQGARAVSVAKSAVSSEVVRPPTSHLSLPESPTN